MRHASPAHRFSDELRRGFDAACERVEPRQIDIAPGGVPIRILVVGDTFAEHLGAALRVVDPSTDPAITVRVFDTASTGVSLAPPPWPLDAYLARDEVAGSGADGFDVSCDVERRVFCLYDRDAAEGWWWAADARNLAPWDPGAPLRNVAHWALRRHGLQLAHGAAVGLDGRGLLLTARGGSGKSTTALSLVAQGWQYVSDDYCLLATEPPLGAHALYGVGKADDATLARLPGLVDHVSNPGRPPSEKAIVDVARTFPNQIVDHLTLSAVVIPDIDPHCSPSCADADPSVDAGRALAPSTTLQLPGCDASTLVALAAATRGLPTYSLRLSPDMTAVPGLLAGLLATLMRVSVVIPVRNGERFLPTACASVRAQTRPADEVRIVVDPTSSDDSVAVAEMLRGWAIVETQRGHGVADAINQGFTGALGDVITFLSCDDELLPDALEAHIAALEADPDAGYSVGSVSYHVDPETGPPEGWRPELLDGPRVARMIETTAVRRATYDLVGPHRATAGASSDVDWFSRANDLGVTSVDVPRTVVRKRVHTASTAHTSLTGTADLLAVVRDAVRRKRDGA